MVHIMIRLYFKRVFSKTERVAEVLQSLGDFDFNFNFARPDMVLV